VRGPGREPVGTAPGLCVQGRPAPPPGLPGPPGPAGPPPCLGVNGRPPWPDCGRIGCPGRGPLGRSLPGVVPGIGPRLPPVGIGGRTGTAGRTDGDVAPAAGRAAAGCVPGCCGRILEGTPCGERAAIGCPGAGEGRGVVAGPVGLDAAAGGGVAGAAGAVAGFAAAGAGCPGLATGAGAAAGGAPGATGFAGAGAAPVAGCVAGACGAAGA
jgi:hypothetical protein